MIAPPVYKCECMTLEKVKGIQKLEEALEIIEKTIKERKGTFKIVNKPQIIGHKDDKDLDDIKIEDEEASDVEEDNEEGMGDLDIDEDEQNEERKEDKAGGKKGKKKMDSDDEESDDDI